VIRGRNSLNSQRNLERNSINENEREHEREHEHEQTAQVVINSQVKSLSHQVVGSVGGRLSLEPEPVLPGTVLSTPGVTVTVTEAQEQGEGEGEGKQGKEEVEWSSSSSSGYKYKQTSQTSQVAPVIVGRSQVMKTQVKGQLEGQSQSQSQYHQDLSPSLSLSIPRRDDSTGIEEEMKESPSPIKRLYHWQEKYSDPFQCERYVCIHAQILSLSVSLSLFLSSFSFSCDITPF